MMRPLIIGLAVLLIIFQYQLWMSPGGLVQIWHLKNDMTTVDNANQNQADKNAALAADVLDLKQGNESIEERARNDLGMVKSGETFYQVTTK